MSLFGGGQLAQIIMQGAQMINQSIQQRLQMEQKHAEAMATIDLKRQAVEAKKQTLEAQAKTNDLEFHQKTLQVRNLQLEQKAKEFNLEEDVFKRNQLYLAASDPVEANRQYESIADLGKRRSDLDAKITNSLSYPAMLEESHPQVRSMREELNGLDISQRYRNEQAAKLYGYGHADAAVPIKVRMPDKQAPETAASQARVMQSFQPPGPMQYPDFTRIATDAATPGPLGNRKASLLELRRSVETARARGKDEVVKLMADLISKMPGATTQEKRDKATELTRLALSEPE